MLAIEYNIDTALKAFVGKLNEVINSTTNLLNSSKLAKRDIVVLVTDSLADKFTSLKVSDLPRVYAHHSPIVDNLGVSTFGHFQNLEYIKVQHPTTLVKTELKGSKYRQEVRCQLVVLGKDPFVITRIINAIVLGLNLNRVINYCVAIYDTPTNALIGKLDDYGYIQIKNIEIPEVSGTIQDGFRVATIELRLSISYFKLNEFTSVFRVGLINP